jgi:hypothetical protein
VFAQQDSADLFSDLLLRQIKAGEHRSHLHSPPAGGLTSHDDSTGHRGFIFLCEAFTLTRGCVIIQILLDLRQCGKG